MRLLHSIWWRNQWRIRWAYVRAHCWCFARILRPHAPVVRTMRIGGGIVQIDAIDRVKGEWWGAPALRIFLTGRDLMP